MAAKVAKGTPTDSISRLCVWKQAWMALPLPYDTPAASTGPARARRQAEQAVAARAQGVTAEVKSSENLMGHRDAMPTGGEGGEELAGGGGGMGGGADAAAQLLRALREAALTPAPRMAPICAVTQAPSAALLLCATPARMKGVASAVMHVVQALAMLAQGTTAAAKFCVVDTGQVTGGGGITDGGGGIPAGGGSDAAEEQVESALRLA